MLTLAEAAKALGIPDDAIQGLLGGILSLGANHGMPKQDLGGTEFRGYDTGAIGGNMPGNLTDPTTRIYDTAGMPNPTLPTQRAGETADDYINRLHDMGFGQADIHDALAGNWMQGDMVVRDPNAGYLFANQVNQPGQDYHINPDGTRQYYPPGGGGAGGGNGGAAGGGSGIPGMFDWSSLFRS